MLVVAVVLFLFLLNWRTTFISLTRHSAISILITVIVFQFIGLSINTMTLGGLAIAIGELVDDAVVDVENIFRRLRENRAQAIRDRRCSTRSSPAPRMEVRSGIVYATAIIVLVFVPLFALSGIEGRLFAPLGIAYIVSILASLRHLDHASRRCLPISLLPRMKRLGRAATAGSSAPSRRGNGALLALGLRAGNAS